MSVIRPANLTRVFAAIAPPLVALAVLFVSGCALGPIFKAPVESMDQRDASAPWPAETASAPGPGGTAQRFVRAEDIPGAWWTAFLSPELDALVGKAIAHNPTLDAARQALRAADATRDAGRAGLLAPQVTAGLDASRGRAARTTAPGATARSQYGATLGVSYALDPFGANRREVEALATRVDYQRFEVDATYLTLVGNVVSAAIREASLRDQLQATLDIVALENRQVTIVQAQRDAGAVPLSAVLAQRAQAAQTRATVPALQKAIAQTEDELAIYLGETPADAPRAPLSLAGLRLPADLPLTLPSTLVRQRPDVRASEALLHAASAEVGVATANMFPQVNLRGEVGGQALSAGKLFSPTAALWNLAGSLTQPVFDGGALRARKRSSEAAYAQAESQYRAVVLGAFRDVADTLVAIVYDADTLARTNEAEQLADRSLQVATRQHGLGATSTLELIDSQRTYRQARLGRVQAETARYADTAALFQSLGGGWWNRQDVDPTLSIR